MNKLTFTLGTVILGLVVVFSFVLLVSGERTAQATSPSATALSIATTSTAYTFVTDTRIMSTTTGAGLTRAYATICTTSASPVAINMDRDKPVVASSTVAFIAGAAGYNACYEITERNLYQGSVHASSTVGTAQVFVTEYVQ